MREIGRMLGFVAVIIFAAICGAWIERDQAREKAAKAPIVQKVAEIEKRIVYLVDDLRTCQSASPVVCTCETMEAGEARKIEQVGRSETP